MDSNQKGQVVTLTNLDYATLRFTDNLGRNSNIDKSQIVSIEAEGDAVFIVLSTGSVYPIYYYTNALGITGTSATNLRDNISLVVSEYNIAGGDLSGTYPNPTVVKIQGRSVANTAPTNGQAMVWNNTNSQWEASTISASGSAGGDLSGTYPNPTVVKIRGRAVANTAPTNGQLYMWNAGTSQFEPVSIIPQFGLLNTIYSDNIASGSHTGNTNNTQIYSFQLASNTFTSLSRARLRVKTNKTGVTGGATVFFYINTANTISGATLIARGSFASTTRTLQNVRDLVFISSTQFKILSNASSTVSSDVTVTDVDTIVTYDVTQSYYIIVSVQLGAASDTVSMNYVELNKM